MKLTTRILTISATLALAATSLGLVAPTGAAAIVHSASVDIDTLDMVPVRTWGVSGQDPTQTQTQSLDVLVWDFAEIGDRMFVGGAFLNAQENKHSTPVPQPYVAAFNINTGEFIDSWRPQIDRAVYSLDVLPSGSLLVGGEFEHVNGTQRAGLVALDPLTGEIDQTFASSIERPWTELRGVVRDLKVEGDSVYAAGNFSHAKGPFGQRVRVYKAARFSAADGLVDTGWKPQVTGSAIWGIETDQSRGEVHFTGFFSAVNGEADTGYFHTVTATDGTSAAGKLELARNLPAVEPEFYDVAMGSDVLFTVGEQHIVHVLDPDDHELLGYHHSGLNDGFDYTGGFSGGAYQVAERVGDIVFAGCHCTYSTRNGIDNHYSSFTGSRTNNRLVMAYDASTGHLLNQFSPDIHSQRDGTWAIASDTNGCLYVGGDFHVGGVDNARNRWLGGFAKLCSPGWDDQPVDPEPQEPGVLVSPGATWSFDDTGADLGTAWREPGFDDGAWTVGPSEMGFGDGDEATTLTAGNVTYYARTSFEFAGDPPAGLSLDLAADDGAIVFLNGVEVLRDNLPAGPVTASTGAVDWRVGAAEELQNHLIGSAALVQGTNTVAVEIHNTWSGNNDLSFDLGLTMTDQAPEPNVDGELITAGSTWTYTDSAAGAPPDWPVGLDAAAAAAAGEFGFGDGGETTVLTAGRSSYYFSTEFSVIDAASIQQLELSTLADDGAVIYINGVEVHRYNMPEGIITPESRPVNWIGGADEAFKSVTIGAEPLVNGTNTVTVEVHNFWAGNSDLSFDLSLTKANA